MNILEVIKYYTRLPGVFVCFSLFLPSLLLLSHLFVSVHIVQYVGLNRSESHFVCVCEGDKTESTAEERKRGREGDQRLWQSQALYQK